MKPSASLTLAIVVVGREAVNLASASRASLDLAGMGEKGREIAIGPGHADLLAHRPLGPFDGLGRPAGGEIGKAHADDAN